MKVRYDRPVSRAAAWSSRLGGFALLLFAVATLGHRLAWLDTPNYVAAALLALALSAVGLLLAIAGFASLWRIGAKGGRAAFRGMFCALLLIAPFSFAAWQYVKFPPLSDISTDTESVPEFLEEVPAAGSWLAARQVQKREPFALQRVAYPDLSGRRYEGAIDRVLAAVERVIEQQGLVVSETRGVTPSAEPVKATAPAPGEIIVSAEAEPAASGSGGIVLPFDAPVPIARPQPFNTSVNSDSGGLDRPGEGSFGMPVRSRDVLIQGEATSPVLALRSDFVIRLSEDENTTFVDMRAASRYTAHDLGLNAALIAGFFDALDAEILGIARD